MFFAVLVLVRIHRPKLEKRCIHKVDQLATSIMIKSDRIFTVLELADFRLKTVKYTPFPGPENVDSFFHRPKLEKRCIHKVDQLATSIMIKSDRIFINGRVQTQACRFWNTGNDE